MSYVHHKKNMIPISSKVAKNHINSFPIDMVVARYFCKLKNDL